jgi:hypothetical protein
LISYKIIQPNVIKFGFGDSLEEDIWIYVKEIEPREGLLGYLKGGNIFGIYRLFLTDILLLVVLGSWVRKCQTILKIGSVSPLNTQYLGVRAD